MDKPTNTFNEKPLDFAARDNGSVAPLESFLADPTADPIVDDKTIIEPVVQVEPTVKLEDILGKKVEPIVDDKAKPIDKPIVEVEPVVNLDNIIEKEGSSDYKSFISKLIENKVIDDIDVFEVEGKEITFEDMEIDSDTLMEIFQSSIDEAKEKAKEGRVSTDGVSEFTQKLIEIEKNGGSVKQAIEAYQTYKHPLEGLDMTNESDRQTALVLKYRAKGLEDTEIVSIVQKFEAEGVSEEKAIEAKEELDSAYEKQMTANNEQGIKNVAARKEAIKDYKSKITDSLKGFSLSDSYRKKLVDVATKENKEGQFQLDNMYNEQRKDPNQAADLLLFLSDKEEYVKQVTEKIKREGNLGVMKKIKRIKKGKSSIVIEAEKASTKEKHFLDVKDI